jgi:large subunit ribosomal protein L30
VSRKDPEGIKYYGFTYFPRFPGEKDPPVEPTKLFMVRRIRSLYGCPYWEKKWIMGLKLDDRRSVAIIKNTPMNTSRLYKVKHLIEVIPIKTPHGMPDKPENGFLKENGEYVAYNLLGQHGAENLEECEKMVAEYYKNHMDHPTLTLRLHKRWYSRLDVV